MTICCPLGVRGARCNAVTLSIDDTLAVAVRVGRGAQPADIATELDLSERQVREYLHAIVDALPEPRHQWGSVAELRDTLERRNADV